MSELAKTMQTIPESYSPKAKPEILDMVDEAGKIERLTQTFTYKGVEFEVVRRLDVIWVGCVDYADNNTGESDISATLKRFQGLVGPTPIREKINPDWSASLSINYTCSDKPCGIMFANESYTKKQDERYDIFIQPGGLWLRVEGSDENARVLLGKERADLYEFFGTLRNAANENGYIQNPDVHVEVEYHCHAEYGTPPHSCYAYIPIAKSTENFFPKNKPEIISAMEKLHYGEAKTMEFGEIEIVSLPKMLVASYEVISESPEKTAIEFIENWLQNKGLRVGQDGVRGFGFDCHKGREIPGNCRIYHVYYSVPDSIKGDSDIRVKEFPGGKFARLNIANPFMGDFPLGWGMIVKWVFENNVKNSLGCTSPDDCYSLFSNEDTPCLEEIYWDNGVQYMALYLPVKEDN